MSLPHPQPLSSLHDGVRWPGGEAPYYVPIRNEVEIFTACHKRGLPVMLKGPTGCGKTRFVEHMAHVLGRPLVTIACHDDLSASDLTGRYLIRGGETVWVKWDAKKYPYLTAVRWDKEGPLTLAVQTREQKELVLLRADPATGETTALLTERDVRSAAGWVKL